MSQAPPIFTTRLLIVAVAFVAIAITWSAHWSDCKFQAVLHTTLANDHRQKSAGATEAEIARTRRVVEWHAEMGRRFERAAWIPWPVTPAEPPRPE